MKAGTALHEQNGVATPSVAAATFATPRRRPPSSSRVRSTLRNEQIVTMKMMPASRAGSGRVEDEEPDQLPRRLSGESPTASNSSQFQNGPFTR
jgi:hypothetical protein